MTEEELAASVVEWLRLEEWDVYQEVATGYANPRADIVAVRNPVIWVIEVKTTLGLGVIAQAWNWTAFAHFVSVAVPASPRNSKTRAFASIVCHDYGIGVLSLDGPRIVGKSKPRLNRKALTHHIRPYLMEEQRSYAPAGNADAQYWTPFRSTCDQLRKLVRDGPITIRDAMDKINHHYASDATARASILKWANLGKVQGVAVDDSTKPYRLISIE